MKAEHGGQLIFASMRSSARDACAGLSIASDPTPPADGAPAYLEEVLPAR
jgi:hypothetical protein